MTEDKQREKAARVWLPPPVAFLLCAVVGGALHWGGWRLPVTEAWLPRTIGALAFGGCGVLLLLSARRLFVRSGQDPRPWKPSPQMVLEGPYHFSRNPMYIAMLLVQVSLGLAFNCLWMVLLSPVALLIVHFTAVLPEERYLAERFGADYERFKRQVRRYI